MICSSEMASFIAYLQSEKRVSLHTVEAYRSDLEQFEAYLSQHLQLNSILQADTACVKTWIASLVEEGISTRSIRRKISSLKAFFKYQKRLGRLSVNPMEQVHIPKISKRLPEYVALDEMNKLFSSDLFENTAEGWRDRAVLELFYATGMRLSELLNLRKNDIDFYEQSVKVLGKRNKERIIPLTPTALEVLRTHLNYLTENSVIKMENPYIFVTVQGKKIYPKAIERIVQKYLQMVTTIHKKSPHTIRHTIATHLLNNGADINAVKEILGHANLAATQIYTHNSIEKLKNIYQQAHPRA